MNENILNLAIELATNLSPAKIRAITERVSGKPILNTSMVPLDTVGSKNARMTLEQLLILCVDQSIHGDVLAGVLLGASVAGQRWKTEHEIELVWTGPNTPHVPTRQTEQVLLDLIRDAKREIFIVSFVAYDFLSIIKALNTACKNGVVVRILLEASKADGGSLDIDPVAMMKAGVTSARLYTWVDRQAPFTQGRVHAKIALADERVAFLSSANLTGHAMAKNMEAGLLVRGGSVPRNLNEHLHALIDTDVLKEV